MTFVYATLLRPPGPGAIPREGLKYCGFDETRAPSGRNAWGWCAYSRKLSREEVLHYDLEHMYTIDCENEKEDDNKMKRIYDLRINSHGKAEPMSDGFFASTAKLVSGYNETDYVVREFADCAYRISKYNLDKPCIQDFLARKAKKEEEKKMKKHMVQFEAGEGREISGGVNFLICMDIPELYVEIAVPEGASDDYGYLTLKARILEQAEAAGIDTDTLGFWYDGQEDKLAADADAEKKYHVQRDFWSEWGENVDEDTVITTDELINLSREWEKPVDELLEQLEEI